MNLIDFIKSIVNAKKYGSAKTISAEGLENVDYFKELALYTAISYIANAISKCEIKTYVKGEEVKEKAYYIFNYSPNPNQNASEFWHKVVEKMFYEGEALVIAIKEKIYCADSYGIENLPIIGNVYTGITIDGFQLNSRYRADEVYIFKLDNKEVKKIIDGINISYSRIMSYAIDNYRKSNSTKYKLKLGYLKAGNEEFNKEYEEMIEEQLRSFINSTDSVYTEYEGDSLEDISPKTNVKDSTDISNIRKEIFETTFQALNIPQSLMHGNITNMNDVVKAFITFGVDPVAEMITKELTRKQGNDYQQSYNFWKNGDYCKVDTSTINHIDIFDVADKVDKLISSGVNCIDELRKNIGYPELNTEFSKTHFITKNYDTIENRLKGGDEVEK